LIDVLFGALIGSLIALLMHTYLEKLISKISFIKKAKKMMPEIDSNMLKKGGAGVRAQALDTEGNLLMDFRIERFENQIHVLNAPSPGATASLAIANYIINNYIN